LPDHLFGIGHAVTVLDAGERGELLITARRGIAQGTDTLRQHVHCVPRLGVLRHEHQVQSLEHRSGHVPVEIVRLQIQRVGVRQHPRQSIGDVAPVFFRKTNIDAGCLYFAHDVLLR